MLTETFLGNLDERWHQVCGAWQTAQQITHSNVQVKIAYQPPSEPAFVSWVVMWQEADGTLKMSFTQVNGDVAHYPPTYNMAVPGVEYVLKTLKSSDHGATWQDMNCDELLDQLNSGNSHEHYARCLQRPDGSLLRILQWSNPEVKLDSWPRANDYAYNPDFEHLPWPFQPRMRQDPYYPKHCFVQESFDGGMTWQTCYSGKTGVWMNMFRLLADGNLCATVTAGDNRDDFVLYESSDWGRTWSGPAVALPELCRKLCDRYTEENDLIETSNGGLLIVHRCANSLPFQSIIRRSAPGKYELESFSPMVIGDNIGQPFLHKGSDGTIWHCGGSGAIWATLDEGENWQKVFTPGNLYYPQLLETRPGHIMSLSHYRIGDDAFPHYFDSAIRQVEFDFERCGIIRQSAGRYPLGSANETSILLAKDTKLRDLHMHVEAQMGYAVSLLFHADADAKSYYAYRVELTDRVDNYQEDWDGHFRKLMHSIVKVVDGKETILWQRGFGRQVSGGWIEMQVKVDGDLIQGAFRAIDTAGRTTRHTEAYYVSVRDSELAAGTVGLRAEAVPPYLTGPAAFRNIQVYDSPMMIRDLWRHESLLPGAGKSTALESDGGRGS